MEPDEVLYREDYSNRQAIPAWIESPGNENEKQRRNAAEQRPLLERALQDFAAVFRLGLSQYRPALRSRSRQPGRRVGGNAQLSNRRRSELKLDHGWKPDLCPPRVNILPGNKKIPAKQAEEPYQVDPKARGAGAQAQDTAHADAAHAAGKPPDAQDRFFCSVRILGHQGKPAWKGTEERGDKEPETDKSRREQVGKMVRDRFDYPVPQQPISPYPVL